MTDANIGFSAASEYRRSSRPKRAAAHQARELLPAGRRELVLATAQCSPPGAKNQDRILTVSSLAPNGDGVTGLTLMAVADGVSGADDGALASEIAIGVAGEFIIRQIIIPTINQQGISSRHGTIREVLVAAISEANRRIFESSRERRISMSTTLTALLVVGASAHLVHVGDSRAYAIEPGGIRQLTLDHSLGARLACIGQSGNGSNGRNILYRALGIDYHMEAQVSSFQINGALGFILCSDGLWSAVDPATVQAVAAQSMRARSVCDALVAGAASELNDDASAVVALFE